MYYFDVIIYLFRYFVTKHLTNHDKCAIFIIVEHMPKFKLFGFFIDLFVWYCTIVFNANLILLESIKLLKATFFFKSSDIVVMGMEKNILFNWWESIVKIYPHLRFCLCIIPKNILFLYSSIFAITFVVLWEQCCSM